jgi:outer membrane protein OmpA-like peptidoglycan-associated protein
MRFQNWFILGIIIPASLLLGQGEPKKPIIKVAPLPRSINTEFNEFGPSLTADGKTLYFYSKRNSATNTDIFRSTFSNGKWGVPQEVTELNSEFDDQSPFVEPGGRFMIISSNRDGSIEFRVPQGIGVSRDLYYSENINGRWTTPAPLSNAINTEEMEENPFVFGEYIYFSRYPFGNPKKSKIYRSKLTATDIYPADELPEEINYPNSQTISAVISPDGQYMYFASDRPGGYGGLDIYRSRMYEDGTFGPAENLGPEINTKADEAYMIVSHSDGMIYFCRRNLDANKDYDIYSAKIEDDSDPLVPPLMPSRPIASKPGRPDPRFELPPKKEPPRTEYLVTKGKLKPNERDTLIPRNKDLDKITETLKEKKKLTLNNVNFDINSSDLLPESFPILNAIVAYMKENKELRIKVTGHTDLTGDLDFNQQLSWDRAESVKKYFISQGLESNRIVTDGKGSSMPIINDKKPESNKINRRTEFDILEPKK